MSPDRLDTLFEKLKAEGYFKHEMSEATKTAIIDMKEDINSIKNNHLKHIQDSLDSFGSDLNNIKLEMVEYKTNQKWMKLIGGVSIGNAISVIIAIMLYFLTK